MKDDEKNHLEADCKNIESKLLERLLLRAVCNKTVDEIIKNLFLCSL